MGFKSFSQAGQDRFAFEVLGRPSTGMFLDIGANNPIDINNTYALEQQGWRGLLVDNSKESIHACEDARISTSLLLDAASDGQWAPRLWALFGGLVDYLSLDIDEATLPAFQKLMDSSTRFRVITVETDAYRFGPGPRDAMLTLLKQHGYEVLCADVCDQGLPFEIWAVDPKLVDMKLAEPFRRDKPTEWKEFFQ